MPEAEGTGGIPSIADESAVDPETGLPPSEWQQRLDAVNPFTRDGRLKTPTEDRLQAASKIDRQSGLPKQEGGR